MELIKYSPKFNQLMSMDHEAVFLLTGFIRQNNNSKYVIPYCVISTIGAHWNTIQVTKLIKLLSQNMNICQLTTKYLVRYVQFKFILFVEELFSLQIYPFKGVYEYYDFKMKNTIEMKIIKTNFGTCWKALPYAKSIEFKIDVIKEKTCGDKFQYSLKISLIGSGLFQGIIRIKLKASPPHQEAQLQILLWEESDITQGFTIYKEESKSSPRKIKSLIVINE